MSTTITCDEVEVIPELVTEYRSARASRNRLHQIIGRPDPDVTLAAAGLRTGILEVWCTTHEIALEVEALHAGIGVLELYDDDLPDLAMSYVVGDGQIETIPNMGVPERWRVRVPYAQVIP